MKRRRPHVAYVCADRGVPIGGWKGSSAHVEELTRALRAGGAEVRIIAARSGAEAEGVIDLGAERSSRRMRQALAAALNGRSVETAATETYGLLLNQALSKALERLQRSWRIDAVYERYSDDSLFGFDDQADFDHHDLLTLARGKSPYKAPVWIDVGDQDPLRPAAEKLADELRDDGADVSFHVWPGGHAGEYWDRHFEDYLEFYADACS